jgi:GNAT superfamily N-acetyltransferase
MLSNTDLKRKMIGLWKSTFHDSDAYISLVFDTYFDPELVEYELDGGELVAALLGIPYEFGNVDHKVKALYLCGLATQPQHRSRGIMTRLIDRINDKARAAGYAFTFLIPVDAKMRNYYYDRGYVNAFYRVIDNYTSLHDFDREFDSVLMEQKGKVYELKKKAFQALQTGYINQEQTDEDAVKGIASLIKNSEQNQSDFRIIHSEKDVDTLIKENAISNGTIFYVKNTRGDVTAAAFTFNHEKSVVDLMRVYAVDEGSRFKLLGAVKSHYSDASMRVFRSSLEMDRATLWKRSYGYYDPQSAPSQNVSVTERVYSLAAHAKVYGMIRILDLCEILKFQATSRRELKYSILVKEDDPDTVKHITTKNGIVDVKVQPMDDLEKSQYISLMSAKDVGEILFRRRDTDNLITEAFGIPSINASASLLLD